MRNRLEFAINVLQFKKSIMTYNPMIKNISTCLTLIILVLVSTSSANATSKPDLNYYFGTQAPFDDTLIFDPDVPTPESVLGYQVGEWHVRPEQIAEYMYALAASSKRVWVEEIGRSWEQRPLLLVSFSSKGNIAKLPAIQQQQVNIKQRSKQAPAVVWMGYSVHGNEASGSNAAVLLAYYLAAAQGQQVQQFLDDTVVLLDPMINPDGLARFASWVNSRKSAQLISDPNDIEHNEVWPQGRTNHYWFDLNRDWLLAQHPESRARLEQFHQWKPLVLTDFHEMGTNSSYFFQPGVPSRQNPITPQKNFDLTAKIAEYHGKALDTIGSSYYSKEGFDDFYYGKGSTYPDVNGSIGILFEQASARGHAQDSVNGVLTFPFAVRNQLTASFSTLKAVHEQKAALQAYQKEFYSSAEELADDHKIKAYVYGAAGDKTKLREFNKLLAQHKIEFHALARDLKVDGKQFKKSNAYIVPTQQPQFRLIRSFFETQTSFKDNTFYDVSSWTLALSFNLNFSGLDSGDFSSRMLGKPGDQEKQQPVFVLDEKTIALAIDWHDFNAATLTTRLMKAGVRLKVATKSSRMKTLSGEQTSAPGSVILPLGIQDIAREELAYLIGDSNKDLSVAVQQITSGLATQGIDLGSPSIKSLIQPKPLLVIGSGVSSYDAGEVWHLLDQRLEIPLVKITQSQLSSIPLHDYTHIILVNGRYGFSDKTNQKIEDWIEQGGQLVVNRTAGRWLAKQSWSPIEKVDDEEIITSDMSYAERDDYLSEKVIGGAIFNTRVDVTHPLGFGLTDENLPVFRRGTDVYRSKQNPFSTISRYTDSPLISGYASKENQEKIAGTPAIVAVRKGRGGVIYYANNMNFRAFWWGTSKLFSNSLYFPYAYYSSYK
jgi:hypothetical protein